MKLTILNGQTRQGSSWVQVGPGPVDLLILDGLRVDNSPPQGLALQGIGEYYKPFCEKGLTVLWLGRPQHLKEGLDLSGLSEYLAEDVKELGRPYRAVLATGTGGPLALAWAQTHPDAVPALFFVSTGPALSVEGQSLYENLLEQARHFRWPRVHALLAKTVFIRRWSQAFGAALAWIFSGDLGQPEDPWDFLVTLQAELAWSRKAAPPYGGPLWVFQGSHDPLYSPADTQHWAKSQAQGHYVAFKNRAQGLLKTEPDKLLEGVLTFLRSVSGAPFSGPKG